MLQETAFEVEGIAPILMHNGRLADPLDQYAQALKEISGKRQKTEADYAEMSEIQWMGGVYWSDDLGLYMPGLNLEAGMVAASKKLKLGPKFKAGIMIDDAPIKHKGKSDYDDLKVDPRFRDRRGVKVSQSRVMRTRPKIPLPWSLSFVVQWDDSQINAKQVPQVVEILGRQIGIGDYIPKHGRFTIKG